MEFKAFEKRIWLSSPTMHGAELKYVEEAYNTNWVSTIGKNIDEIEKSISEKVGAKYAVALSCGTAALHLAMKLAGVKAGDKVFCSDMTFGATVNPVVYENGVPVFIDSDYETWNMDPKSLKKAFELYPEVKVVVVANLYGTPSKFDEILEICNEHGAVLIEDAAESLGATYKGKQTGMFGRYGVVSFNGNKIITGSSGGMLVTDDYDAAMLARKYSTQSRDAAPWYQHTQIGYNYRMSNIIAGVVRGQFEYLDEHVDKKRQIYERYKEGLKDLPLTLNPFVEGDMEPNFWLSCILIDKNAMCTQVRGDNTVTFVKENGKSCPTEIMEKLEKYNVESRPIWKPMHMQPIYKNNPSVTANDVSVCEDVFERGLCLPSDIKMTKEEQDVVIEIIKSCF